MIRRLVSRLARVKTTFAASTAHHHTGCGMPRPWGVIAHQPQITAARKIDAATTFGRFR